MKNWARPDSASLNILFVSFQPTFYGDDHTHHQEVIPPQVEGLLDVDRLDDELTLVCELDKGDSLVSFSSLNEHNLALSGCWITLKEYNLPSELSHR